MRVLIRRVLPALAAIQLLTGALIFLRGFPYYGSLPVRTAPLWELPVAIFHLPAITLLSLSGHCCGLGRGMVIGPRIRAGHIRVSAGGLSVLLATNWPAWMILSFLAGSAWRRWRPARQPEHDHA